MKTDTSSKIVEYIEKHGQVQAHELHEWLKISRVAVHKQLKNLLLQGKIEKKGNPPVVFYTCRHQEDRSSVPELAAISQEAGKSIGDNFLSITPDGRILYGLEGFSYWYKKHQSRKDISQIALEYHAAILHKNNAREKSGAYDATEKLETNFKDQIVDRLLVAETYSIPVFGRTRLAKLVMYAKQVGDSRLVDEITTEVRPIIEQTISNFSLDSVVFVPPTVPRPVQFMDLLERSLKLQLENINIVKVIPGQIPVPQKTLSTLEERIINARDSFFIKEAFKGKRILLIDDVVGSGASLHEIASKLMRINPHIKKIIAFAIVGNVKGYEVVRTI